jgi:hypothetical protein
MRSQNGRGSATQNIGKAGGCKRSGLIARMLPTRTEDRALQRCNLSAVPGARCSDRFGPKAGGLRSPTFLANRQNSLWIWHDAKKSFVAGRHDCDLTGCPHAQQICVRRAAKPRLPIGGAGKPRFRDIDHHSLFHRRYLSRAKAWGNLATNRVDEPAQYAGPQNWMLEVRIHAWKRCLHNRNQPNSGDCGGGNSFKPFNSDPAHPCCRRVCRVWHPYGQP